MKKKNLILILLISALTIVFNPFAVIAKNSEENPDTYISMSPTSIPVELAPGEVKEGYFTVANIGAKSFDYTISTEPFTMSSGTYKFNFGETNDYSLLSEWVTYDRTEGHLEPNSTQRINYTIHVPEKVSPGGQYAAMTATTITKQEAQGGASISVGKSVATIIYASVPGEAKHEGAVIENKIPQFFFAPPINANSLISNTGNIHEEAEYYFEVKEFFGDKTIYTNEEKPLTHYILPETERYETQSWDGAPQLGIFKVKQTIKYLGQVSVEEKIVFIVPLWLIFIILFMIFAAIFWARSKAKERKKNQKANSSESEE